MKSTSFAFGVIGAVAIIASAASAQNADYSAESIIKHFEQSGADADGCTGGDCIAKSGTRGLSIGAAPTQPVPAAPTAEPVYAAPAPATGEMPMGTIAPATGEPPMGAIAPAETASTEPRMGAIVPSEPAPQPAASADGFNLLITFELGSARLTSQAQANLDEFVAAVSDPRLASAVFAINGHTDASGDAGYNLTLSEERAASVVDYLTAKGVSPSRLVPRGFGEEQPRTADPYDGANRRVEATLISQ